MSGIGDTGHLIIGDRGDLILGDRGDLREMCTKYRLYDHEV